MKLLFPLVDKGVPEELYWSSLTATLKETAKEKNWTKAVTIHKGQILFKEVLVHSLPQLSSNFDEKMEQVYHLYLLHGHEDWSEGMTNVIDHLKKYSHSSRAAVEVPGI